MIIPEGDFDAYIFDCDGTLADSMPLHYKAWCKALGEHDADFPEALFYELGGVPAVGIIEILNERHGYQLPVEETAHIKEALFTKMICEIAPIAPVVALVHQFHGQFPLAVASGGMRAIVTKTLDSIGLNGKFDAIVCCEDYSNGKPAPDPFLVAASRLKLPDGRPVDPARCLVFEDTQTGIQAAEAAGMKWVLVPPQR